MAFDPNLEDYQRLELRFARSLRGGDSTRVAQAFAGFGRRFAQDRDSLPQTDADRAFHLVSVATEAIDYKLPLAGDEEAERLINTGHELLDEALALDPDCFDAQRMMEAANIPTFGGYLDYLAKKEDEVRAYCEAASKEARERAFRDFPPDEASLLEADIAMRPYLRWLACEAERALICGRNRETIRICQRGFEADPKDQADLRFTCALAYAKLEDEAGLEKLASMRVRMGSAKAPNGFDAWLLIALISLAHSQNDTRKARSHLHTLLSSYPHAASALVMQRELPDGIFARLNVAPFSEDELILAVSEATVLFQEGRNNTGRGPLGTWVAAEAERLHPGEVRRLRRFLEQQESANPPAGQDGGEGA